VFNFRPSSALKLVLISTFLVGSDRARYASQAENAGSIPVARSVARSKFDFVATTDEIGGNTAVGVQQHRSKRDVKQ
jgi:hypothetical protein